MKLVRDIMTKDPAVCAPETPLPTVARLMCDHDCGEIPVVDSKATMKPVGVITDRDITCRAVGFGRNPLELRAADCMTKNPFAVTPDSSIDDLAELLEDRKIRRALVTDVDGKVVGIVSQADLAVRGSAEKAGEVVREVSRSH